MKIFNFLCLSIFFCLFGLNQNVLAQTNTPKILETTLIQADYGDQIMTKGLVEPNNLILVYINGSYSGFANISKNDPEIYSFSYLSPVIKTNSALNYKITVIAKNQQTFVLSAPTESPVSSVIKASSLKEINKPKPEIIKQTTTPDNKETTTTISAPILITPRGNIGEYKPIISGFSKNQTTVKLFIDNVLETSFYINDGNPDNVSFKYTPLKKLDRGLHFVYATASNQDGIESKKSNILYFYIADPQYTETSTPEIEIGATSSLVFQKTNPTSSTEEFLIKTNTINAAINISIFILFIACVIVWFITTKQQLGKNNILNNINKNGSLKK